MRATYHTSNHWSGQLKLELVLGLSVVALEEPRVVDTGSAVEPTVKVIKVDGV
jgi:hypothetical protein